MNTDNSHTLQTCDVHDVHDLFFQEQKLYIVFSALGFDGTFLYFSDESHGARALYASKQMKEQVRNARVAGACIECNTCTGVDMGVCTSSKENEAVEINMDHQLANRIIAALRKKLIDIHPGVIDHVQDV